MTAASTATERRVDAVPDLRRASRLLAAILLPVGPAAVAVLRFVLPYTTADSTEDVVASVQAHQTAQNAVVWLGLLACLTLVPAVIFAGRVVGRRSPRLAGTATVLLVLGYIALAWLNVSDAMLLYGVRHDLSATVLADMYSGIHPAQTVAEILFVAGHVLGTILLGVGMLRGRVVAPALAWATIVAQPIHFVAAVIVGSHALDLVGWGLNAVGFAALSVAILRLADDEWAPPPVAR
jgi:hypothetical protein